MRENIQSPENLRAKELEILKQGIIKAGDICLGYWRKSILAVEQKGSIHEIVTPADKASEQFLKEWIQKNFPGDQILSEESYNPEEPRIDIEGRLWIIDPLDGTRNFQRGSWDWSVTGAFIEGGVTRIGITYAPVKKELFYVTEGNGAFLNGKRIFVSRIDKLGDAMPDIDSRMIRKDESGSIRDLLEETRGLSATPSTALALAYFAKGGLDIVIRRDQSWWDCTAGMILVKEANGKFTNWENLEQFDYSGEKNNNILATNGLLHQEALSYLKS